MANRTDTERLAWVCWSRMDDVQHVQTMALSRICNTGMSVEERALAIRQAIDQQMDLEERCAEKQRLIADLLKHTRPSKRD